MIVAKRMKVSYKRGAKRKSPKTGGYRKVSQYGRLSKTYRRRYRKKGGLHSYAVSGSTDVNVVINHPFNDGIFDPPKPIGVICNLAYTSSFPVTPYDIVLTHNVTSDNFTSTTLVMMQYPIFLKYKALYKYFRIKRIVASYIPAMTSGMVVQQVSVAEAPKNYASAIVGNLVNDVTRDVDEYNADYPLSAEAENEARTKKGARSVSIYRSWKRSFVPSVKQDKLPDNNPLNTLLYTKYAPWQEFDDYDVGIIIKGMGLVLRGRMPTWAGRPYPEAEEVNDAYPPLGESVIIGRLNFRSYFEFKGLRY